MAAEETERSIPLAAVFNFRDLGGYRAAGGQRVRWRRLFRADGLNRLTAGDETVVRPLGLATVVDLRTSEEVGRGRFPEAFGPVAYHHLPMFDVLPDWSGAPDPTGPGFLADRYVEMLHEGRTTVAAILRLLAHPQSYPLVFHCAAGKDRTGIVAALVLELLGVDRATVAADYALSHEAMERLEEWIVRTRPDWAGRGGRPEVVLQARPETMERFLAAVDALHGSVAGLAADLGIGPEQLEAARTHLLEPAPPAPSA